MNIKTKQLKNGFKIPIFGIGTYNMAEGEDKRDQDSILNALELGVTHIDTAESYANGNCEKLVGECIKKFNRNQIFLVSKVKYENLSYKGIKQAIQNSLNRLQTNYLDLYLMHRCPKEESFEECVLAMNELKDLGLIKNIGLSNTNTKHTADLLKFSKHPFVVNQVHYNLQFREPEKDGLLKFCQEKDMFLEAWRPVNKGDKNKSGMNITKPGITILDQLCKKYDKTPAQISINWLISQTNVITLAKSSNINHLKENLSALDWEMEKQDIEKITKFFPDQKFISDTVPLA